MDQPRCRVVQGGGRASPLDECTTDAAHSPRSTLMLLAGVAGRSAKTTSAAAQGSAQSGALRPVDPHFSRPSQISYQTRSPQYPGSRLWCAMAKI
jgi:hypothetical protein